MEGFPIGEDEDILNLSDPPYYTACPNPWLNDFISEWEDEKKQLESEGKRSSDFVVDEPYASDVIEGKNNPIYNAHSYHTKVPHPAIMRYLLHYTQPGDIVFDGFAGTGMTGVAASLCGNPNSEFKHLIEKQNKTINWGQRKAICSDLSPIASLINAIYNVSSEHRVNFLEDSTEVIKRIKNKFDWMYKTMHQGKEIGIINYVVWSEVFLCPECNSDVNFWDSAVNGLEVNSEFNCLSCGTLLDKRKLEKKWETVIDTDSNELTKKIVYKPVFVNYKVDKKSFEKPCDEYDLKLIEKTANYDLQGIKQLNNLFQKGDKTREFSNKGISKLKDLYTKRTLIILSELYVELRTKEQKALFTASIVNLSKTARYKFKRSGNVPMSGTIYVSSLIAESNVFNAFNSKIKAMKKAYNLLSDNQKNLNGINSATCLENINSNSLDYLFVDPPFGANLMYSELSSHWENWLNIKTNIVKEAIENRTQRKTTFDYQILIQQSFLEFYRILKPGKWMTVEFSNTSAAVWNSIQISIQNTGFIVANISALDKKQGSYNAVMNPTSVKQDLIISCYKPSSEFDEKFKQHQSSDIAVWDFVEEHLHHLPIHLTSGNSTTAIIERSPKILFDRLIAFYIQKGLPVPIDAGKFQKGLRERFIERDGMFFTNEQVQEYDKKKAENPEFIQLSILVSSEQDGVLWLKNLLTDKSLTYQDIQPLWMQALAGVRKGDVIPELADILEENFLKDTEGKWYTPDPENEADLEKLRTKRLLKQFDTYKTEAAKPKAKKIKEVRVEALRAGFKQCYQDKDFSSIVSVGDKIPNNLLMEDEVLLQFYDIASSRV
jgi:DNA modification methylase